MLLNDFRKRGQQVMLLNDFLKRVQQVMLSEELGWATKS
jgi:hypothetical protein